MSWTSRLPWKRRERELREELEAHLAMARRERIERGERPESAELAVRREFGNRALVAETTRAMWGWGWLERLGQDLRYGARCMRRSPGFTAVAVASLALGIGANTAIFSLIDALLLRSLPVSEPQSLIHVKLRGPFDTISYPLVGLLAEQREIFSAVAGFSGWEYAVGPPGAIRKARGALVTGGYYRTLGLSPAAGRLLTADDDRPGAPLAAVITYGYWERQFARNPAAVGETIPVNGHPVTIVGVTPAGFTGANVGAVADITLPVAALPQIRPDMAGLAGPGNFWLIALARVKEGISREEARARLAAAWPGIAEQAAPASWPPDRRKGLLEAKIDFQPGGTGWTYLRGVYEKPLLVLMGVVALVLLIACANVANLLLARAAVRRKEIAIRLATGAGRGRIVRQLLTESGLLAATGAAVGIALAMLSSRALVNLISSDRMPIALDLAPNGQVLGFTAATAIATALLFGAAPAFQSTAVAPLAMMKDGVRGRSRLLGALVSVQVALSLLLLIGAGLFVRTLRNLEKIDPGFRREGVLLVDLDGHRSTGFRELVEAVRRTPGVLSAAISTHTPLNGSTWSEPVALPGQELPTRDNAVFVAAGPGYVETLRIPMLAGRSFTEQDGGGVVWPAVVNEELSRRMFGANPVGQRLSARVRGKTAVLEIVGVVRDTAQRNLRAKPYPTVYVPYAQVTAEILSTLTARASGSLAQVSAGIQKAVQAKLPEAAIEVRSLSSQVEATIAQERMMAALAGAFGMLALALAGVGLYGLLNYGVARR
ncbi:MAG TPA: ABC transporter permease, partial [Gemmatimonadales bacterium]